MIETHHDTHVDAMTATGPVRRVVIMNPKGGCGKTTVATNLASRYAALGCRAALFDYDPLGASMRWLRNRTAPLAEIHGVAAFARPSTGMTRTYQQRIPDAIRRIVVDTPAALERQQLLDRIANADVVLIPVLPSPMDMGATADLVHDLLRLGKVQTRHVHIGMIANRVRTNTAAWQDLKRYLHTLDIPLATTVRDSQHYVTAAHQGKGVHELALQRGGERECWNELIDWVEAAVAKLESAESSHG